MTVTVASAPQHSNDCARCRILERGQVRTLYLLRTFYLRSLLLVYQCWCRVLCKRFLVYMVRLSVYEQIETMCVHSSVRDARTLFDSGLGQAYIAESVVG